MFRTTATYAKQKSPSVVFGYAENYKLSAESGQHNRQQAIMKP
jgi:hypothetical protein